MLMVGDHGVTSGRAGMLGPCASLDEGGSGSTGHGLPVGGSGWPFKGGAVPRATRSGVTDCHGE